MLLLLAGLAAIASCAHRSGPAPVVASATAGCARCHAEETRTWEASLHHRAFTDVDFQRAFAHEPEPFCVGCHAPSATSRSDPRVADGVVCAACHTTARDRGDGRGLHPVGPARSCDGCHDFEDPAGNLALQKTAQEHARSPFRDVACKGCHMSGRDHAFAGGRDLERLRAATRLDVTARDGAVEVVVDARDVGHAFPSGDLFRRVRVLAWRETAAGRVVASDERVFERTFEPGTGPRRERADGRIEGEARFTLDLAADEAAPRVTVQLFYERGASRAGDTLSLFSSDVLHERTVTMKGPR